MNTIENSYQDEYNQFLTKNSLAELNNNITTNAKSISTFKDGAIGLDQTTIGSLSLSEEIKSSNFKSGQLGWHIVGDGSAEFNNGVFRGDLTSATINIPNSTTPLFTVDSAGNVVAASLRRKDFHWFTTFESLDGYSLSAGLGSGLGLEGVNLATAATTNATASLSFQKTHFKGFSWDKNCSIKVCLDLSSSWSSGTHYLNIGRGASNVGGSADNGRHLSFRVINGNIYGSCGDGTSETQLLLQAITTSDVILSLDYSAGVGCSFYVNDTLKGTITTNLPSTTVPTAGYLLFAGIQTGENVSKGIDLFYYDLWQAL